MLNTKMGRVLDHLRVVLVAEQNGNFQIQVFVQALGIHERATEMYRNWRSRTMKRENFFLPTTADFFQLGCPNYLNYP